MYVCKTRYKAIVRARIKTEWINQRPPFPPPPIQRGMMNESMVCICDICPRKVLNGDDFCLKWRDTRRYL